MGAIPRLLHSCFFLGLNHPWATLPPVPLLLTQFYPSPNFPSGVLSQLKSTVPALVRDLAVGDTVTITWADGFI